jgi:hypothetical protein
MLNFTETLSVFAIVISVASFGVSGYVAFRDRGRLKITSKFIAASENGPSRIVASIVNVGRRPVILRLIGGFAADRKWSAIFIERDAGGMRLGEHERYEHRFTKEDTVSFPPEDEGLFLETLWVEDTLGVRHAIPKSREYIKKLWV